MVSSPIKLEAQKVLEFRVKKATKHQLYMACLIKWRHKKNLEATWIAKEDFKNVGISKEILSIGVTWFFFVGEYDT